MSKVSKWFWYFCTVLMTVLSGYIFRQCGFTMTYADNLKNFIQPGRLPFVMFALALSLGLLLVRLPGLLGRLSEKQRQWTAAAVFGVLVLGQMMFLLTFRTALRGDQMKVFEAAIELMDSKTIAASSYNEYFSRCSNNIPLTLVTYLFVNVFRLLHLPEHIWMDCARAIGTAFLDGGLVFAYLTLKKLRGSRAALLLLILAVCNPMLYLLTGVYYSSTISLFFGMGAIWLCLRAKEAGGKKWLNLLLTGIFLGFGFKIRATAFICGIALGICGILGWRTKEDIKRGLSGFAASLAGFVLVIGLFSVLHGVYVQADYSDTEYTMLHYVMMGANGNGTYSPTDAAYTQSFDGKEAKIAANKERLLERLEAQGPAGIMELMGRKLTITFSDGVDDYMDAFNGVIGDAGHLKYLNGSKRDFFAGYCHLYNTVLWLGILISLVAGLWKKDRKNFVILLSALGGIAFQLIWECGEAYSVPYTVLFLMLAAEGFGAASELTEPVFRKKAVSRGSICGAVFALAAVSAWIIRGFSGIIVVNDDYRVRQTTYELTVPAADDIAEQTFTASEPFNEIELYVYNVMKEHNQNIYLATLLDENHEKIAEEVIDGYMLPQYGSAYMQFDTVIPQKESVYTIRIESIVKDEKSGLVFPYHDTGLSDLYHGGSLCINGSEYKNCDLAFTVYLRTESTGL